LDPLYYLSDLAIFTDRQITASIGELCSSMYSGFAAGKETQVKKESGYIQIRPTNIMPDGRLSFEKNVYVPKNRNYTFIPQKAVLFNNTNSQELVGKTAILDLPNEDQYYCSNHITVIIPDQTKLIPEYLWIILNLYQRRTIFYSICTNWNNQSGVNVNLLKSVRIPIFSKEANVSLDYQRKIVAIWLEAFSVERTKEQEAKDLLDSIDDYLLSELGIERPERTENGRFFYTSFREIEGKRIDPYYNHPYFKKAYNSLHKTPYPVLGLGELSTLIASGSTPPSGGEDYTTKENGIMFVRSGDITNDCNIIDSSDMLYITKECHNTKMRQSQLRYGDILIAIVGATIGAVNIYNYNAEANINQAIALVRLKSGINELFITEQLRSSIGRLNLEHQKRPVARANINLDEIAQMELILPPLEIQDKIAENIQSIRDQAKYLQQEAKEIINNAKQKIEQMILGK
jgi:type I restriction enzyme S subunit